MGMRFEDFDVWKVSARLASDLYKATSELKDWDFRDQITRAGLSISSNIAEGLERDSQADCVRFLGYAKSSAAEVRSQLYIAVDIGYIDKDNAKDWIKKTERIAGMLASLIKKKKEFARKASEESAEYTPDSCDPLPR